MKNHQTPEERLFNSAPRVVRLHPWDDGVPEKSIEEVKEQNNNKDEKNNFLVYFIKKIKNIFNKNKQNINNQIVEQQISEEENTPIISAIKYYDGCYIDKMPDPEKFIEIVKKHGSPDWPNPFTQDSVSYYRFHPLGFLAADLEVILDGWYERMENEEHEGDSVNIPGTDKIQKNEKINEWLTIEEAEWLQHVQQKTEQNEARKLARVCWAILMQYGNGLPYLSNNVHPENLSLALEECILEEEIKNWGLNIDEVIEGARKQNIYRLNS
jgi:hypothetical protein